MFRAIGFVIVLYALANMLDSSFVAFESASVAVLGTIETAAELSTEQLKQQVPTP